MRDFWNFYSSGRLLYGRGTVHKIGQICKNRDWTKVFIVTDRILVELGLHDAIVQSLEKCGLSFEIFDGGEPEPTVQVAHSAISSAQEFQPDVILGLGGGSNMDLAKIVACGWTHGGHPSDFYGFDKVPGPVCPIICIPTTAGTGSEVTHAAVLTDLDLKLKVSTLSPYFRPALALVDPLLTVSCPSKITAESGMDALTHAIEAYTNVHYYDLPVPEDMEMPYDGKSPIGDIFAEKAIRLIGLHLERAVHHPNDLEAREGMSLAATLAGLAFSNSGVALVHGLEYPLGGEHYCTHGQGNALLLPYMMSFNRSVRKKEMAQIASWLGEETTQLSTEEASHLAISKVESLKKNTGIPLKLRELGVPESELPRFAETTSKIDRLMQLNPRTPSVTELLQILTSAY